MGNKVTELLNIKYPIFQGAMAKISMHKLVSAVSNAGGLGIITSGGMSAEEVRKEVRKCKELTDKPFAVNLMMMMTNINEIIYILVEEDVRIVTTGAGTPKPYMQKLKKENFTVIPVIPSVDIAKKMEALGADAVVVEGTEAGGHVGESTTMSLLPQVVDAVSIPVLGAGGIADSRGILAAISLGASGVQIGTLFLAADECPIPDSYKKAVIEAKDNSTIVTGRTNGSLVRCIENEMTRRFLELEYKNVEREELEKLTLGSLSRSVYDGDMVNGSIMDGQIAGMIKERKSVKEIIDGLIDGLEEANRAATESMKKWHA